MATFYRPPPPPRIRFAQPRLAPYFHGKGGYLPPPQAPPLAPMRSYNPYGFTRTAPQNTGRPVGPVQPPPPPPRAPVVPGATWAQPPPLSDDQIQAQAAAHAKAIYDPLIQQIVDMINRRGQQGTADIAALTGEYAKAAGGYAAALPGIYGPAKAELATTAQFLADRLQGQGASTGQDLAAALAQAGAKGPGDINLAQEGAGAGNAAYGTGIATLDALIAREASAETVAAGEPSRAFAGGQQQLGLFQRVLANQLAQQSGALTSQIPGTAEQIAQGLYAKQAGERTFAEQQREFNAQQAAAAAAQAQQQRQYAASTAENQRRYNASVARQKTLDTQTTQANWTNKLITLKGNKEAETGQVYRIVSKRPGVGGIQPVFDKQGNPVLTPQEKTRRQSASVTAENLKNTKVGRIITLGTVTDPKTGQRTLTPSARRQIKALTGVDPGPVPPGSQTAGPKTPKVFGSSKSGYFTITADGTVTQVTRPAPTAAKPVDVDVNGSVKTGAWRDSNGKALTPAQISAYGLPPKPPASTTAAGPVAPRQKAVAARRDAWTAARTSVYKDAQAVVNANPGGLAEGSAAWKAAYRSLLGKYRAEVLRYTAAGPGRKGALRQLDAWIRSGLAQTSTRAPSRTTPSKYPWSTPPTKSP